MFGLGGIFVELFEDTVVEMAPLSKDDAHADDPSAKGAPVLTGARGRPRGDIEALATLLVRLSHFAAANSGTFRALDLNPIIVEPTGEGVVAVDIAIEMEPNPQNRGHTMSYKDLIYSVEDRIATITLNRPERMNALSPQSRSRTAPRL